MKKTRILALLMVFLMLAFALTACGGEKETRKPIDIMKASIEKQWDIKSAHSLLKAKAGVEVPPEMVSPEQMVFVEALKDAGFEFESTMDIANGKGHMRADLKAGGGMNFSGEAFLLSEKEMVLTTPLFPQQVLINMDDFKAEYEKQTGQKFPEISFKNNMAMTEDMKPMVNAAMDLIGDMIKDEEYKIESKDVEFSSGKEKITTVSFNYEGDKVMPAFIRMMENAINSENFIKYAEEAFKFNEKLGVKNEGMDLEMLVKNMDEVKKQFSENKEQFEKMVSPYFNFKNFSFSFGVDKQDIMRTSSLNMDLEIKNPMNIEQVFPIKISFDAQTDMVDAVKAEEIKTITPDPANSIKIQDLINNVLD